MMRRSSQMARRKVRRLSSQVRTWKSVPSACSWRSATSLSNRSSVRRLLALQVRHGGGRLAAIVNQFAQRTREPRRPLG